MANWGDVQCYNEIIEEIGNFCTKVEESCQVMLAAVQTCMDNMEGDEASLTAQKNVLLSLKKYEEAISTAHKLASDLSEERDDLVEYLRKLREMDER